MAQLHDSASRREEGGRVADDTAARIFGLETEYGVSLTGTARKFNASSVALEMFSPLTRTLRSTNAYLDNGSRLYLDVGAHPEYATAEARTPFDALLADVAGERIMAAMARKAQESFRKTCGEGAKVHLFKNNVDSAGNSFGCHENYLLRRAIGLQEINDQLLPFLITRQIYTGAGRFVDGKVETTQRAQFVDETVSSATTRSRPMINTRDEPHANPEHYRRLHVIIGDSNRSQWATFMKLATTHMVLCLMESAHRHGYLSGLERMALANPVEANRLVSLFGADAVLELEDGATLTALQMQEHYLSAVEAFIERFPDFIEASLALAPTRGAGWIAGQWRWALEALAAHDMPALARKMDWAAKKRLFNAYAARQGTSIDDPAIAARLEQIDMDYHDVLNGSVFEALMDHGQIDTLATEAAVTRAMHVPPSHTRATLRGDFVAKASQVPSVTYDCDWTHCKVTAPVRASCTLMDPFNDEPDSGYLRMNGVLEALAAGAQDVRMPV